jgi:hypothetical protein
VKPVRYGSRWRCALSRVIGGFRRKRALWLLLFMTAGGAGAWWAVAQQELPRVENRFTFARIRYSMPFSRYGYGRRGRGGGVAPWSHDWPISEENFMKIMAEVTRVDVNPGGHIIGFDSEEVFKYPVAYLCEVGYMSLSPQEAQNMREYLLRGGFLIVDDFRGPQELDNFIYQMKLVFPERALENLPHDHPIFTCFYDISALNLIPPYSQNLIPVYMGMSDDAGRLMMVVDYNNDISDYWEWSGDPFTPISDTNEAFKYGVNYVMYALTH